MVLTGGEQKGEELFGGCHCGAVRFSLRVLRYEALRCNCSICRKKGHMHHIVPHEQFTLLKGEDNLATYRFNTRVAEHKFCRICGVAPFYIPRSHPECVDINLRCLDDDILDRFTVQAFDGMNWEENVHQIRGESNNQSES